MPDLKSFLDALGLGGYAEILAENDVELDILPDLSDADLAALGLSLGHRRKLLAAAQRMKDAPPGEAPSAPEPPRTGQAERRQVTVLFADLVGSTELSRRMDPEDLSRLVRQYQDACAGAIARFDGFLAKFMGDGVLAYFGYPQAHEDNAERAARAGLAIVEAVQRIGDGTLAARIGISTGLVVVGEIIGSGPSAEQTIVGDTPNLAARLQALAPPNAVLIGGMTRRLLGELFEYDFLGEHELKGIETPIGAWRVLRESETASRFRAVRSAGPLVGRDHEIALLAERWRRARAGEGQAVLLQGEAGIGKSRLVEALIERLYDERHVSVRMQCSPYHRNTALHPVIRHLGETAGFAPDDDAALRREKLRATLGAARPLPEKSFRLLADLLGLGDGAEAVPGMTAAQQKRALMDVLAERLFALAAEAPVLLLLEDAHWIDPTTRELYDAIIDRLETAQVLVVVTHRPEFVPPWTGRPFVTSLAFNRLSGEDCGVIVRNVAAQSSLSGELVTEILRRGDGVPLYVEELTRAVLEAGAVRAPAVPPTLQDSLMSRLDRLGRVKDVAQVASVIGRDFSRDLLGGIADTPDAEIDAALEGLIGAGLVFRRGAPGDGRFSFKHALLQEAAYESLLKSRRETLHERAARALEASGTAAAEPEIAALHFARAVRPAEASRYWEAAGDKAVAHSSYAEAIASYVAAIEYARQAGDAAASRQRILALVLKLGPAIIVAQGFGSPEVAKAYREAHALAQELGENRALFKATWGLWMSEVVHRRFEAAGKRGDELIVLSRAIDDEGMLLEAIHCRWSTAFFRGETALSLDLSKQGMAQYDPARHHKLTHEYGGHDPGLCARGVCACGLSLTGFAGQARSVAADELALAHSLSHPNSLAHAFLQVLLVYQILGDVEGSARLAQNTIELAQKYSLPAPRMHGDFGAGWALVMRGETAAGVALMEDAFARRMLTPMHEFLFSAFMAETYLGIGRARDGLAVIDAILPQTATSEIGLFVPELWRMKGELTLATAAGERAAARAAFERAATMAAGQGAFLLQLRAETGLARLLAESGERALALTRLAPVLARFTEDRDQADVAAAVRLHAQLA